MRVELLDTLHRSIRTTIQRARLADGTPVVVKLPSVEHPSSDDVALIEREYELLQRVAGPGIIRALGLEEIGSKPALVLEGGDFVRLPAEALPIATCLHVATELARALARVHARGLVHGDVNPANVVWRAADGEVRLIDLGVAFEPVDARAASGRTLAGTVEFIAPEQTGRTSGGIDHRADLYSLGVTCFVWLTGTLPFVEADLLGYVHAHLSKTPPRVIDRVAVPAVLGQIVQRLLAKEPDARYQSADALLADLEVCARQYAATGTIAPFELGTRERARRLALPHALIERETQIGILAAIRRGLVVVSAPAGTGKSALLDEVAHRRAQAACVAVVRCTAATEHVPLGALAAALAAIADAMLVRPPEELEARRAAWNAAIAPNGAVLVEIEPRLGAVLGPQPRVAELGPREAQQRRKQVVEALFRAVAASEPLVLVIDDAEGLDAPSRRKLLHLAAQRIPGLAVIAAIDASAAGELVAEAVAAGATPDDIECVDLAPLSLAAVTSLVAELVDQPAATAGALARVLHGKTGGNPLFLGELLGRIQDEQLLVHDGASWRWDAEAIAALPVSSTAADVMVERLATLGDDCRAVLAAAACLGIEVELATLRAIAPAGVDVDAALAEADAQRVLLPARGGVRSFAHRGIRDAIYAALPEAQRAALHLAIVRRADLSAPAALATPELFAAVRHARAALALLAGEDRRTVAALEREAAVRARAVAAYAVAADHIEAALALLGDAAPFELRKDRVECVALGGDSARAHDLGRELLAAAPGPLERASVHGLLANTLSYLNRLPEAIEAIRSGLRELGLDLPSDPATFDAAIGAGLGTMQAQLAVTPPSALAALPEMRDPHHVQAMELLFQLIPAAYQIAPPLFVIAELMMLDLAVRHGVVACSAKNFVDCGIIQVKVFGDHARALELADASFALLDRFRPTPHASAVEFVYGAFIAQWRDPPRAILDALDRARHAGAALGDNQHAAYAVAWHAMMRRIAGLPLRGVLDELERAAVFCAAAGVAAPTALVETELEMVRSLMTGAPLAADWLERASVTGPVGLVSAYHFELVRCYVMRDLAGAREAIARLLPIRSSAEGMFADAERLLFLALVAAEDEDPDARTTVATALATFERWTALNPPLFMPYLRMVTAEHRRLAGAPADEVAALYDAIVDDPGCKALHLKAIACERQAAFWSARGRTRIARPLLREAYTFYERWGAEAKLQQLAADHPGELGTPSTRDSRTLLGATQTASRTSIGDAHLDVDSVVKAVSAISSEVKPDRLFAALMKTIVENAGAERGCLISAHDGLWVEARASVDEPPYVTRARLEDAPLVAREVVLYVARTKSNVILANAEADERFARDPYIAAAKVRSLLCVPILAAGELRGVLYVENNAFAGAFTPRHVRMLSIIAGQAATSIENARMYERLEEMVRSRTSELAGKNREMAVLLDNLPQAVFTFGADLRLERGFSARLPAMLGTAAVAGRDVHELLFAGSDVAPDALQAHDQALACSFGTEPFFAELNWPHLVRTFERTTPAGTRMFEVDWASIVDDAGNVGRILATLRDVTELRALERELASAAREAASLDEVLTAGVDSFHAYCGDARARLERCRWMLVSGRAGDAAGALEIYRHLHTLKGNARTLGIASFSRALHAAEEPYAALRGRGASADQIAMFVAGIDRVAALVEERAALVTRKLGDPARGRAAQAEAALEEIGAEVERAQRSPAEVTQALRRIANALRTATHTAVADVVRKAGRVFTSLAAEVGKPVPELVVEGEDILVDATTAHALNDALVHVFRNCLDHGIEPPEQRVRAGKPEAGRVRVAVALRGGDVELTVGDDGRGLRLAALRARPANANADDATLAESIFRPGVSTSTQVTDISGRGVGMDAVRNFVAVLGGGVDVAFTGAERDGFRPFVLVFHVPRYADAA